MTGPYQTPSADNTAASYSMPPPMAPPSGVSPPLYGAADSYPTNRASSTAPQSDVATNEAFDLNTSLLSPSLTESMINNLKEQGYTRGLIDTLWDTKKTMPLRIWLVDNSGSMRESDGKRIVSDPKTKQIKIIPGCSRWAEMQQMMEYHARIAACIEAPSIFRFLNDPVNAGPQQFSIALNGTENIANELSVALQTISNVSPVGVTPLREHILEVRNNIVALEPQLRRDGSKVSIIIATDGLPSDSQGYSTETVKQDFEHALRSLEGLPIWIVVRLLTDDDDVVQYWNEIDRKLELSIEVLDDFESEAKEMHVCNKWLNYGIPLHRLREFGYSNYLIDIIDEKKLSKQELRQFCRILFGHGIMDEAPDVDINWKGFCTMLDKVNSEEKNQYNAITKRMSSWIDMKSIHAQYGGRASGQGACCIMM